MKLVKIVEELNEEDKKKIVIPAKDRKYYVVINITLTGLSKSIVVKEIEKLVKTEESLEIIEKKAEEIIKKILKMKLVL